MLRDNERNVMYYEFAIRSITSTIKGVKPISAREFVYIIKSQFDSGETVYKLNRGSKRYYIPDMCIDDEKSRATILVNLSDVKVADFTYSDPDRQIRDTKKKKRGEGVDVSSHVVIDFNEKEDQSYCLLAEQVSGLSGKTLANFLNSLIKRYQADHGKEFRVPHPDGSKEKDGSPRLIKFTPKMDIAGMLAESFRQDLLNGRLSDIELVKPAKVKKEWEGKKFLTGQRETVFLTPSEDRKVPGWGTMASLFKKAKEENYQRAKIRFVTEDDTSRTAEIDTDTHQLVNDHKYVKKKKISGFEIPLGSSYDKISLTIVRKMEDLL